MTRPVDLVVLLLAWVLLYGPFGAVLYAVTTFLFAFSGAQHRMVPVVQGGFWAVALVVLLAGGIALARTRSLARAVGLMLASAPAERHRSCHRTRSGRTLDRLGYLRFRNWRLYGERGPAGAQAAVWLYEQRLTIAYGDEALAQYHVTSQPDRRHLGTVDQPRLYQTPHRSPPPSLRALGDGEWLPVRRLPAYAARKSGIPTARQPPLFRLDGVLAEEV